MRRLAIATCLLLLQVGAAQGQTRTSDGRCRDSLGRYMNNEACGLPPAGSQGGSTGQGSGQRVGSPSGAGGGPSVSGSGQGGGAWSGGGDGCVLSTAQTSAAARGEVVSIRGANCSVLINGTRFRN